VSGLVAAERALSAVVEALAEHSERFGELDTLAGDGDLGVTVASFCRAARASLPDGHAAPATVEALLIGTARSARANPSTFSGLMSAGLRAAARRLRGRDDVSAGEWGEALAAALDTIMERGGAGLGDKTVVDAMDGSLREYRRAVTEGADAAGCAAALAEGAAEAIGRTRDRAAKAGRAAWLAERTAGVDDPGSVVWLTVCTALREHFTLNG
jgi:hypothetical protein